MEKEECDEYDFFLPRSLDLLPPGDFDLIHGSDQSSPLRGRLEDLSLLLRWPEGWGLK